MGARSSSPTSSGVRPIFRLPKSACLAQAHECDELVRYNLLASENVAGDHGLFDFGVVVTSLFIFILVYVKLSHWCVCCMDIYINCARYS